MEINVGSRVIPGDAAEPHRLVDNALTLPGRHDDGSATELYSFSSLDRLDQPEARY